MKAKAMDKLVRHLNTYFEQDDCMVSHPVVDNGFHVDILVYKPNEKYPFWKLVSMGASDYKMPKIDNTLGLYNEYMMFVDPDVDLEDKQILAWYHNMLSMIASYPYFTHTHVTYSHSLEWAQEDPGEEMIGAFIEFPQIIEDTGLLRCKLGLFKTVTCLQVVLLNRAELDKRMEIGPQAFSDYLYPEDGGKAHFLSERHRSEKF